MILLDFFADKDKFLNIIQKEWLSAKDSFPDFLPAVSDNVKEQNELYLQKLSKDFQLQIKNYSSLPIRRFLWKKKTIKLLKKILYHEPVLQLHKVMDQLTIDSFLEELFEFLRQVRSFAPELSFTDIGQATRNYIVFAMFKLIHNVNSNFSMAAFGYSMLYPFTDNYIDNDLYPSKDKLVYNQIIRDKIMGKKVNPQSIHHKKTCDLLQAIETQYPRDHHNMIYNLLLMMLKAQETSLKQQNKNLPLSMKERIDISIFKGGISVLIDRFFVNKEITESDLIFYLAFGFFLQLADDLQDIKEDSSLGYSTLFTVNLNYVHVEKTVNKLLHFLHKITNDFPADNDNLKSFILETSYQLILISVTESKEYFSENYIKKLEQYLPISYSYIDKYLDNRIEDMNQKHQNKYLNILDVLIK